VYSKLVVTVTNTKSTEVHMTQMFASCWAKRLHHHRWYDNSELYSRSKRCRQWQRQSTV